MIPNFSGLAIGLPNSELINVSAAMARGFSQAGAQLMYIEKQLPESLPDQLLLSRFMPDSSKSLLDIMTPESTPPSPATATATATAATLTSAPAQVRVMHL
jgi:hypothetical protein